MTILDMENKINLLSLIERDYKLKKVGSETYIISPCPVCGGSTDFTVYSKTNSYSSYNKCCNGGSVYKYLQEVKNMNEDQAFTELKKLAGEPKTSVWLHLKKVVL